MSGLEHDFVGPHFKRELGFLADSCLSVVDRIPADVHSQMLWGLPFLVLVLWVGNPSAQSPKGRSLQLRYPSRVSIAVGGCGASLVLISALGIVSM